MYQRLLFDLASPAATICGGRGPLDGLSEALLARFRASHSHAGRPLRSTARDVSQLRALVRASTAADGPQTLAGLFADAHWLATVLSAPPISISRSTGHARLLATQQFIRFMAAEEGRDASMEIAALDRLLPARPAVGWHTTGTVVAGSASRRRRLVPTLAIADLERIVVAAGMQQDSARGARDRALVALQCFTGVRAEELVRLQWEDVTQMVVPPGRLALALHVVRSEREFQLPVHGLAASTMEELAFAQGGTIGRLSGPVFQALGSSRRGLCYRAARDVLRRACRGAGLPAVESSDLRAACAHWLRSRGLSEHDVAVVLGLARVRSVDRLLQRHAAIDAQRRVREVLDR